MAAGDVAVLECLSARLDAQEMELKSLHTTIARLEGAAPSKALAMPSGVGGEGIRPMSVQSVAASRRTLLKGAGAAIFTTALLATGEVVPTEPFPVAAAPSPFPTGGMQTAVTADVIYQFYVGTDFIAEDFTRGSVGLSNSMGATSPGGGPIYQAEGVPVTGFAVRVGLPHGATITEVVFYLYCFDNTTSFVDMARYSGTTTQGTLIGSATSQPTGYHEEIALTPLTYTTVDNTQYSYTIEWRPGSTTGQSLYGARVGYALPGSAQVYGNAEAGVGINGLSTTGIGVQGQSNATTGAGVKGVSASGFPIIGVVTGGTNGNAGVLGVGTAGPGVQGQSHGHGLVGTTSATDGQHAALIGSVQPGGNAVALRGSIPPGATGLAGVFDGDVAINGALRVYGSPKNAAVKHPDGSHRLLYCMESPESWFEDFGKGTLGGGTAEIKLDPDFAALVHTDDYHVFLTEYDDHSSLYVTKVGPTGFTVAAKEAAAPGGTKAPTRLGSGTFSWRVVAKRKDIAGERLAKVAPPPPLKPVTPFTVPVAPEVLPPTTKP